MLFGGPDEFVVRRSVPHTLIMAELEVPLAVLDLTDETVHTVFETAYQELTGSWLLDDEPATQRLGKAAYDCGRVAAIRYPSAQWRGERLHPNLVIFRDRLEQLSGGLMRAVDPDGDLPPTVSRIGPRAPRTRKSAP